jgi:uncharacterized protein Yka (UPF0111/DUF47 family)
MQLAEKAAALGSQSFGTMQQRAMWTEHYKQAIVAVFEPELIARSEAHSETIIRYQEAMKEIFNLRQEIARRDAAIAVAVKSNLPEPPK